MNTIQKSLIFIVLVAYFFMVNVTYAQEKEDAEKTRMTVLSLIETLVKNGNMTRSQADTMMREAEKRAQNKIRVTPLAETTPDGKKVVRVPYIPESVKTEMREQIKSEVLAAQSPKKLEVFCLESPVRSSSLWEISGFAANSICWATTIPPPVD